MNTILVTGGNGFVGKHLIPKLKKHFDKYTILYPNSKKLNCTNINELKDFILFNHCDYIIHLAALCGGIGANSKRPAEFFIENLKMTCNILEASHTCGIKKLITIGTVCSYPKHTPTPFKEEFIWNGYPEETNAPYGFAKKMLMVGCDSFNSQYGCNFVHLIPSNMYGEHDNFDLNSSHVIPALIRKIHEAKVKNIPEVEIWGDGSASREFLYAGDFADSVIYSFLKLNSPDPINIGTGHETKIKDLVEKIKEKIDYKGNIIYNKNKPNGQPKRQLDTSLAKEKIGFEAKTSLDEGLDKTIKWYINNL